MNQKFNNYKWRSVISSNLFYSHDPGAGFFDYSNRKNKELLKLSRNHFISKWGCDRGYQEQNLFWYKKGLLNNKLIVDSSLL
jgi:hypothetical protein